MGQERVYIGLGSNLGDRKGLLVRAVDLLMHTPGVSVQDLSAIRETLPVGLAAEDPDGGGLFLNAVVAAQVRLEPLAVLAELRRIEVALGRVRGTESSGSSGGGEGRKSFSRTMDLDLLLYGDRVLTDAELTLPHPRLHERRFVMDGLAELAPDLIHPVLGKTMLELHRALPPE